MESQPQIPEFRINPEIFHPCVHIPFSIKLMRQLTLHHIGHYQLQKIHINCSVALCLINIVNLTACAFIRS